MTILPPWITPWTAPDAAPRSSRAPTPIRSVLLVEDEPTIAVTLKDDLEEHGYLVTHCGDGAVAWRWLADTTFDAVIADLRLPGRDGVSLLEAARRRSASARLLLITAFAEEGYRRRLLAQAGVLLQKPFANQLVLDWLRDDGEGPANVSPG